MTKDLSDKLGLCERHLNIGAYLAIVLVVSLAVVSCAVGTPGAGSGSGSYVLPSEDGDWIPPVSHVGSMPAGTGKLEIENIGEFAFNASDVETLRPDIFQPGHFSLFDILVYLAGRGDVALDYHFDEMMGTYVIDTIDGQSEWWYEAYYSGGWYERNVFRMDMYPYKNNTKVRLYRERGERLANIYCTFRDEVARLANNGGQVIISEVVIRSPGESRTFRDVRVTAHNVRSDLLQLDTVTALDVILSLGEQGELSRLRLTWYERIGGAEPVDSYWLEQIDGAGASGGCGFVYETGPRDFAGFAGSHIHIPADVRVIVSPEYALWFWICL